MRAVGAPLDAVIDIERAPGAEACPDSAAVFRAIQRLFPERSLRQSNANESAADARVAIRPLASGYEAVMTVVRPRPGERVILEKDEACRGLADALALAFVMLVEPPDAKTAPPTLDAAAEAAGSAAASDAAATPAPSEPEPAAAPRAPPPVPPSASASRRGHAFHGDVGAAVVGGLGVLSEPSLGVAAELTFVHRSGWGVALEGMRLWSAPADGDGGSVTLDLWAFLFGPYYRGRLSRRSSLGAGLLLGFGSQKADVKHFDNPNPGSFPWMVLMPAIDYRLGIGGVASAFARLAPVIQLRPQSFSVLVDATGKTDQIAAAPTVGVLAELGFAFGGDIF